jgi:hypothetical protein
MIQFEQLPLTLGPFTQRRLRKQSRKVLSALFFFASLRETIRLLPLPGAILE